MNNIWRTFIDWSETWAPLIPLVAYYVYKPKANWVRPLKIYLIFAFITALLIDIIWKRRDLGIDDWLYQNFTSLYNDKDNLDNTLLYNIHSIVRFFLLAWFFTILNRALKRVNIVMLFVFIGVAVANFGFYQDIRDFSSILLGIEAACLLVYCLVYFFVMLKNENMTIKTNPEFWTVIGLSIYVVIDFPIFLFYNSLASQAEEFSIQLWDVHNICFILMCALMAKSFYAASTRS